MDKINVFITHILQGGDLMQTARHEAGHRFMWGMAYPEVATHYIVVNGLPGVSPDEDGEQQHKIAEMSIEDASRMAYIKLAGHASEMVYLGIASDEDVDAIAEWLVDDYCSDDQSLLDWNDDASGRGDISEAFRIIGWKVGWNRETLRQNISAILKSIVKSMRDSDAEYEAECNEAFQQFACWQAQGKIKI